MDKIVLYTSDTCHRCRLVKQILNTHSIEYEEVTNRDLMLSMDLESIPAIEVGDTIIDNYSSVLNWLNKNGYYSLEVNENDGN